MLKPFSFTKSKQALTVGFGTLLILIIAITLLGIWRIYVINSASIEALGRGAKSECRSRNADCTADYQPAAARKPCIDCLAARDGAARDDIYREPIMMLRQWQSRCSALLDRLDQMEVTAPERAAVKQALDAANRAKGSCATASNRRLADAR